LSGARLPLASGPAQQESVASDHAAHVPLAAVGWRSADLVKDAGRG